MFSILHISDLHRSESDPVSNSELISSLISDCGRHCSETVVIPKWDAAVITGDLILGVKLGENNWESKIQQQYDIVFEFLSELAARFFNGDHSKIIIVPGNHDVNWNRAFSSMEEVTDVKEYVPNLINKRNSDYRWDWKTLTLYHIRDRAQYNSRLEHYNSFYNKFYNGSGGPIYSDPENEFSLFELDDGNIVVSAFNSCQINDCFCDHGFISGEVISKAHLKIKDYGIYKLKIAAWHHSIGGHPSESDYMNSDTLKLMIDKGFRLGLHGHQHKAEIVSLHIDLPKRSTMGVVSAGSLCASRFELPTGRNRQYNVVEICDSYQKCRVHIREMSIANVFSPGHYYGNSFAELEWNPELDLMGNVIDKDRVITAKDIEKAEGLFRENRFQDSIEILNKHKNELPDHGHKLLIQCLDGMGDWNNLLVYGKPQSSISELMLCVKAAKYLKNWDLLNKLLNESTILTPNQRSELITRFAIERELDNV